MHIIISLIIHTVSFLMLFLATCELLTLPPSIILCCLSNTNYTLAQYTIIHKIIIRYTTQVRMHWKYYFHLRMKINPFSIGSTYNIILAYSCVQEEITKMSNELWNSGTTYELLIYKIIMWPLGIWPLNRGEIFSDIRLSLAAITQAATFICLDIEMWNNCRGLGDVLDIFVLSIFSLLACVKGLLARYHQDEIYSNVSSAVDDWYTLSITDNSSNRKIMMKHARIGRIVCISLMAPASGGTLSWIILALPLPIFAMENSTDAIRNFPLQTACTFESLTTSTMYYIIFVVQIYQLIATCLGNCGNDVFFFGLGMHACGQLEILRNEFRTFVSEDMMEIDRKKFKMLVERHTHLLNLVEKLEDSFNLIILSQLIMSGLLICIMGIQVIIALKIGDLFSGVNAGIVLSSLMSQLFLYSYGGDYLTSQNENLAFAAYESMWYNCPVKTMRDIGFVTFRAGKPINITAGKFVQMTLATFMDILKLAVSYMSVLRIAIDI